MSNQKRLAYKAAFKLEVIKFAKEHGNRAAERHFGPPPTEKMIREWRKQEDQLTKLGKNKHNLRKPTAKWSELEVEVKEWITSHRQNGISVSTKMIINEAKRIAVEKGIQDFTGSPSWCYRFMKRSGFSIYQNLPRQPWIPSRFCKFPQAAGQRDIQGRYLILCCLQSSLLLPTSGSTLLQMNL
uniref:HTH CENPB-type domain-containing protein n=1 Tax=Pelusios castaneus TaxID=367368 RepID=A0A8C8S1R3_9SAUR